MFFFFCFTLQLDHESHTHTPSFFCECFAGPNWLDSFFGCVHFFVCLFLISSWDPCSFFCLLRFRHKIKQKANKINKRNETESGWTKPNQGHIKRFTCRPMRLVYLILGNLSSCERTLSVLYTPMNSIFIFMHRARSFMFRLVSFVWFFLLVVCFAIVWYSKRTKTDLCDRIFTSACTIHLLATSYFDLDWKLNVHSAGKTADFLCVWYANSYSCMKWQECATNDQWSHSLRVTLVGKLGLWVITNQICLDSIHLLNDYSALVFIGIYSNHMQIHSRRMTR